MAKPHEIEARLLQLLRIAIMRVVRGGVSDIGKLLVAVRSPDDQTIAVYGKSSFFTELNRTYSDPGANLVCRMAVFLDFRLERVQIRGFWLRELRLPNRQRLYVRMRFSSHNCFNQAFGRLYLPSLFI